MIWKYRAISAGVSILLFAFDGSHTAYVRHGDQSEEATSRELNELILQGMNQTFDALPSSYRVGDVSFTLGRDV